MESILWRGRDISAFFLVLAQDQSPVQIHWTQIKPDLKKYED